ncbi:LysR family transcriptional regulator [Janthinobacterium sp. 64]|uniref:LysR family transcriptional regulator n=1 Tax=Janthinobacterium sp. 64 TaxID=2035208 RepID=UPI000C2C3141|nr:LysR family transcriptional regulator [Janthinobacterium sp. 64]PKB24324.1 LysR family transcriptional regulator [Janthinobacterium sp. 64]
MKLPDLNLLVALDILLEEGSAVAAARRMNLSAPAMSRTLARIRDAIGDPVFVRSGRGLAPTPRALELREQVRGVVEQAHAIFTSGREIDLRTLERTFSLCANDVFVGAYGGKLRDLLAVHAPHTVLRFVPEGDGATENDALHAGRIDLYISARRAFAPDIKLQQLFSSGFVGIARSDHPLFDGPINLDSFTEYEHISVSRRGLARGPFDTALAERGYTRRVSLISPNFQSAIFAVADSRLLLPLMPTPLLAIVERLGLKLRTFELPIPVDSVEVFQAWHPRLDHDHAHRWLRRMIKDLCTGSDSCGSDPGI